MSARTIQPRKSIEALSVVQEEDVTDRALDPATDYDRHTEFDN